MNEELVQKLNERHPKIFEQPPLISVGDGWFMLVDVLCGELQSVVDNNGGEQIKIHCIDEKFGEMRISAGPFYDAQLGMIDLATALSREMCDVCGAAGRLRGPGWIRARCDEHVFTGVSCVKPRFFLDTEFTDFVDCQLISLAIVGHGFEWYGEVTDFDPGVCSDFVRAAVLPQLGRFSGRAMPFEQLRGDVRRWLVKLADLVGEPTLCFDQQTDLDLLLDLLDGPLPAGWRHENIAAKIDGAKQQEWYEIYATRGGRHHALNDARADAFACGAD
jgi:hypothetical protein